MTVCEKGVTILIFTDENTKFGDGEEFAPGNRARQLLYVVRLQKGGSETGFGDRSIAVWTCGGLTQFRVRGVPSLCCPWGFTKQRQATVERK